MAPETPQKVIILTALPVEHEAVLRHLSDIRGEQHPKGTQYQLGRLGPLTVSVARIGPGNSNAAAETERMISHFNPDLAFFIGVAGGVKDVDLGDVVAATKVYGYESGTDKDVFLPRPEVGLASYPLVQQASAVICEEKWLNRIRDRAPRVPRAEVSTRFAKISRKSHRTWALAWAKSKTGTRLNY